MNDKKVNNGYAYNGNLAYDYRYDEDYDNKFDIRVEKTRGLSKARPKMGILPFFSAIVAAAVITLLFQHTQISTLENQIEKVKKEIKVTEDEIYNVDVAISEARDNTLIKKLAKGSLGMVEPTDEQFMYISVPNSDYTVTHTVY